MGRKKIFIVIAVLFSLQLACATVSGIFDGEGQESQPGQEATAVIVEEEEALEPTAPAPTQAPADDEEQAPAEEPTEPAEPAETGEEQTGDLGVEPVSGLCGHPYFPISEDQIWTYKITDPNAGTSFYTIEYRDVTDDSFVLHEEFSESGGEQDFAEIEMEWECTERGLRSSDYGHLEVLNYGGEEGMPVFTYETLDSGGIDLPIPDDWEVGSTWQTTYLMKGVSQLEGVGEITSTIDIKIDNQIVGVESLTVEAGTFDESVKVEGTTTITTTMFMAGMSTPFTFSVDTDTWYAENVGMIKTMERDFNSVTELVALEEK